MNFRSVAQLSSQLMRWSTELPRDIEVIVGLPRSGLLAANLLALYMNIPLTDLDGFLSGRCFMSGDRRQKLASNLSSDVDYLKRPRRVLVVDDSTLSGRAIRTARARIEAAGLPHAISYAAVYASPEALKGVDFHCEVLNAPRVFEWNVMHGEILWQFCISLEGVLIRPERRRARELSGQHDGVPPVVPSTEVGWIVTTRPESCRAETEDWLTAHGIQFRQLVMFDGAGPLSAGMEAAFKAEVYLSTDATLYIDESFRQSVEIARLTKRHVLCTRTMQLVHPGTVPLATADLPTELHPTRPPTLKQAIASFGKAAARRVLPWQAHDSLRRWLRSL
jgi:orotate phosphoribosyltransferase